MNFRTYMKSMKIEDGMKISYQGKDYLCTIIKEGKLVKHKIENNQAVITDENISVGDNVTAVFNSYRKGCK